MGIVYRAVDERDGRVVALKVIREAETSGDESVPHVAEARQRFEREADILKGLLHANIVTFYEIGEEDGTPFLAMEFLEGKPLGSYAGRPYAETLPLLIQAAHGLEYLASRGIVHRDLSPDNIFVVDNGGEKIVKLLDFGVAKLFDPGAQGESLTATGFFLGKVAYGSPEQLGALGHGAALDWRSDAYSLGVIAYQVLAGRKPFEAKVPVEYIAAHLNLPAPPCAAPPDAPPLPMDLVRLVAQMLEKRREDRPKGYREITQRMLSALRSAGSAPRAGDVGEDDEGKRTPTGPTQLVGQAASERSASRRALERTTAAVLVSAAALAILVWAGIANRSRRPRAPAPSPAAAGKATPAAAGPAAPRLPLSELRIASLPAARVVAVVEAGSGRSVPIPDAASTPVSLALPEGRYRVSLAALPPLERRVERDVEVGRAPAVLTVALLSPEELVETLR